MADEARKRYEAAIDLFGRGRLEEAAQALTELIGEHPDFADGYETLGMIYYRMGRLDEAIDWTGKLVRLKPQYVMAHANLSVFYMKKGMKEKAEEEKAKATVLSFGGRMT